MDRERVRASIATLFEEVSKPNWDGYNALPVPKEVEISTMTVIDVLPVRIQDPSLGAEPDGCITIEWYKSQEHLLSLSVGCGGLISYAGILNGRNVAGGVFVEELFEVPDLLVENFYQH